ncbi:hypothetical protein F5Y12DRAFT_791900 [Xylaria sp. FL1777]|nr:hypothetical protein F5Y12DRAFT_791900 [Xylaria sp. FL1777]
MNPQIHEWQKAILPDPNSEEVIGIAKVFSDCSGLWGAVTRILAQQQWVKKETLRRLESAHSYIRIWADGYDVLSGQFEERLKNSQRAGDQTIRLLQNICRTLTQELTPVVAATPTIASQDATSLSLTAADLALSSERLAVLVQGDNDSESSEDGEAVPPSASVPREKLLDDIADDLRSDTQCLLDLGARFEEQVMNPIASEAAANPLNLFDGGVSDTFIERITRLYPLCETNLAGRLGKANRLRFLKIAEQRSRKSDGRLIQGRDVNMTRDAAETESIGFKSILGIAPTREQSLFHDSGLGTASYISVSHPRMNVREPESERYPPLPDGAIHGKPFRCTVCTDQVTISTKRTWRLHLLLDIEPYVCPEPDCDVPLFASSSRWEEHVLSHHPESTIWNDSRCRICGKTASNKDKMLILTHLASHMEDIAFAIIPRGPGTEVDKVPVSDTHEGNESPTASPKQDYEKTLQSTSRPSKTACNPCKMKKIKCDEKKPSCVNCTMNKVVCNGYPPSPRPPEAGTNSKFIESRFPFRKPQDTDVQNTILFNHDDTWLPLFPEADEIPNSRLENDFVDSMGAQDKAQGHTLDSLFVKPPLPASTHLGLSDSTTPVHSTNSSNSYATPSNSDLSWNFWPADDVPIPLFPPVELDSTVDNTRTQKRPEDTTFQLFGLQKPLPPIIVDDPTDIVHMKRARNTLAARKSRERKVQQLEELEKKITKLEQERDKWKSVAMEHRAELP